MWDGRHEWRMEGICDKKSREPLRGNEEEKKGWEKMREMKEERQMGSNQWGEGQGKEE